MGKSKATTTLDACLKLTDKLSEPLKKIRGKIKGLNRAFKNTGNELQGVMTKLTAPLTLLAGGGILSMRSTISEFMDFGDSIDKASIRAGVGVEALQKFRYAAGLGGMQTEEMDNALAKLGTQMGAIANGEGDKLASLFDELGVRYKDVNGKVRNSADVMRELADAVKANKDPTVRLNMLSQIFGDKLGKKLIPVLEGGAAGLDAVAKEAEELGIILDKDAIAQAAHLNDQFSKMKLVFQSVSMAIGAKLAPVITDLVDKIRDAFKANKDLIATKVDKYVRQISDVVSKVDFGKLIDGFFNTLDVITSLLDKVGGLKTIFMVWGAIIGGKFVVNLWNLGASLVGIGKALSALTGGKMLVSLLSFSKTLFSLSKTLVFFTSGVFLKGITGLASGLFALGKAVVLASGVILKGITGLASGLFALGKNIVLGMGPLGWILTGVAAAAYVVYKNWDTICECCKGAWAWLQAKWLPIWADIQAAFEKVGEVFGLVKTKISDGIETIKATVTGVFDDPIGSAKKAGKAYLNAMLWPFNQLRQRLGGIVDKIKSMIPDWLKDMIGNKTEIKAETRTADLTKRAPLSATTGQTSNSFARIEVAAASGSTAVVRDLHMENGELYVENNSGFSMVDL